MQKWADLWKLLPQNTSKLKLKKFHYFGLFSDMFCIICHTALINKWIVTFLWLWSKNVSSHGSKLKWRPFQIKTRISLVLRTYCKHIDSWRWFVICGWNWNPCIPFELWNVDFERLKNSRLCLTWNRKETFQNLRSMQSFLTIKEVLNSLQSIPYPFLTQEIWPSDQKTFFWWRRVKSSRQLSSAASVQPKHTH